MTDTASIKHRFKRVISSLVASSKTSKAKSGQTLIEVLVVITLLGILMVPILLSLHNLNARYKSLTWEAQANLITQENLEVVTNIAQSDNGWARLPHPGMPTSYAPPSRTNNWQFQPAHEPVRVKHRYKTQLTFQPVCRNEEGVIAEFEPNCNIDPDLMEVISVTEWEDGKSVKQARLRTMFTEL